MATLAQFHSFGPFWHNSQLVTAPRLFHYDAGTSVLKNAWVDRAKLATAAQPIVGNANGLVDGFFDGLYKIVITLSDEVTVVDTWDMFSIIEAQTKLQGTLLWNPGNLVDGAGETSPPITVTGALPGDYVMASVPYDLQGVICTAYVSAANTVRIRLQNETGGAVDLASATWLVRVLFF